MQKQNPQDVQQQVNELNVQLKAEIRKQLTAIAFPFEKVAGKNKEELSKVLNGILEKTSLDMLKVDLPVFQQLVSEDYNLFSISFLLNSIPKHSAKELGLTVKEYMDLIALSYELGAVHTEMAKPIQEQLQAEFQKKADALFQQEAVVKQADTKRKNKSVISLGAKR